MFTYNNVLDMIEHNVTLNEMFFISNDGFIFVVDKFDGENVLSICGIKDANIDHYSDDIILNIEENNDGRTFRLYQPDKNDVITYNYTPFNMVY